MSSGGIKRLICRLRGGCQLWVSGADRQQRYWFRCAFCKREVREGER